MQPCRLLPHPLDDESKFLSSATLDELYPDHGAYVSQAVAAVNALKAQGLLLQGDASAIKKAAAQSSIGK